MRTFSLARGSTPKAAVGASPKATILLFLAMWGIGVGAFETVNTFQSRVDNARQAQVVVETLQGQIGDLATAAFSPVLAGRQTPAIRARTKLMFVIDTRVIDQSLAMLPQLGSSGEDQRIQALSRPYLVQIARIASLVSRGSAPVAIVDFGRSQQPGGAYGKLSAELVQAIARYGDSARSSRRIASIATGVSIAFMLIAFSLTLYRATRLAREKQRLLQRSQVEALTDALTGLPNRRSLFADMESLLAESPPPTDVALAMFDLDGFKHYNDTFGHPAGDALLTRCAQRLTSAVGAHGRAYRMGGDEFCAIARGPDGEKRLAAVADALGERGEGYDVRCSRGSMVIAPGTMTLEHALQLADQRLYDDKRLSLNGRLSAGPRELAVGALEPVY